MRLSAIHLVHQMGSSRRVIGRDGIRVDARAWVLFLFTLVHPQILLAVERGELAPDFTLPPLRVAEIRLAQTVSLADYRGKVVYLDFWDSWCAPCRESLPALDALRDEFSRADFEIVAVNLDADPAAGRRFLSRYPVGYPVASDPSARVSLTYELQGLPTAFLIGRDGLVHHVHQGFRLEDMRKIRAELVALLAQSG